MKQAPRNSSLILSLLLLVVMLPASSFGQAINGNIVGTVIDPSGAAVANADVSALSVATAFTTAAKTDGMGGYRFDNLPVGTYKVTIKASGFRTSTVTVDVLLNATATANVQMQLGAASETVEVTGATPIIDTTTANLQTTFEEKLLQDLPTANFGLATNGQNLGVLNLSLLDAGVGTSGGLGAGTGPAISGQRPRNNNFTVEGVDNNNKGVTGPLIYVPTDAVSNFTLLQNQFSPEFGHSTGGQFNIVVASGTNAFHGKAYEYFQNRNLNAIDQAVANATTSGKPVNPRYDNNRFGGQLGGPIIKSKLFFFVNYERNPLGLATFLGQPILAPTAGGYSVLEGLEGVSAGNIAGLKQYALAPTACSAADVASQICPGTTVPVNGSNVEIGIVPVIAPNYQNLNSLTTSMDYVIGEKDRLSGRYIYNKWTAIDNTPNLPVFYTSLEQPFHLINISEYHTFSPMLSNEFRVGYNRWAYDYTVPDFTFGSLDQFPNLTIDELNNLNVGPDPNAPQYSVQNTYQATDNLTWIKGAHTLKFGVEYRKYISPQLFVQRSRGDYEWETLESYANDALPVFAERSFGSAGYSGDQYAVYGYVNDIWKIRPNVSLNLGVRYEYTSTPYGWTQQSLNNVADVPGLITFGSPEAPTKNFMPRVGLAWSPGSSGDTSIRAGFGMGYDVLYDNIGTLSRPPQIGSTEDCSVTSPGSCSSPFLGQGGIPPQQSSGITVLTPEEARAATSSYLPNHVQYPFSIQWNVGIQQVFLKDFTADVRYVGTRGGHLNVQNRINVINPVTPDNSLPTYLSAPTQGVLDALPVTLDDLQSQSILDPRYESAGFTNPIVGYMPWGDSIYHGLQTQLNKRFSNGLQFQVAYTWSHAIDNATADFFSTIIAPRRPENFRDLASERSNSVIDHRHRFTVSAVYDLPFFKKSDSWLARNLLGNYEIVPVYTYESGQWATVQSGVDSNLNGDNAGDRVILNSAGVKGTGSDVSALTNSDGATVAYLATNPAAQYIVAGPGALADSGRANFTTPNINNWDLSIGKHIAFTERYRLDLTASFFNAFNHPQFTTGSVNQATSVSATTQRNYLIPSKSTFNQPRVTWGSNPRQVALGVKFIF